MIKRMKKTKMKVYSRTPGKQGLRITVQHYYAARRACCHRKQYETGLASRIGFPTDQRRIQEQQQLADKSHTAISGEKSNSTPGHYPIDSDQLGFKFIVLGFGPARYLVFTEKHLCANMADR
jgi:hypothetical protein